MGVATQWDGEPPSGHSRKEKWWPLQGPSTAPQQRVDSEALTLSVLEFLTGLKLCNIVAFCFKQSLVKEQNRAEPSFISQGK